MQILFVCNGNVGRSSFAEYALRSILEKQDVTDVHVSSAGMSSKYVGQSVPYEALEAAKMLGVDISSHRSKSISPEIVNRSNEIYTFEKAIEIKLKSDFPEASSKISTLAEIADTKGKDMEFYTARYNEMYTAITKLVIKKGWV